MNTRNMWPLGFLLPLGNLNRTPLFFKKSNELCLFYMLNYKNVVSRTCVYNTCKSLSNIQERCSLLCKMKPKYHNNFISIRKMAVDVESIPPPYEYIDPKSKEEVVNVTFIYDDGMEQKVRGKVGDNLLLLALRHKVNIEGACEAQMACTSCHVYVDEKYQELLEEKCEEEEDLLDNAPFLKENSRLGCQIILKKELDGLRLTVPKATINFYVDGHVPKH